MRPQNSVRRLLLCMPLAIAACETLEQQAPPVSAKTIALAADRGVPANALILGREILTNQCIDCHSVQPVGKYSPAQWRAIVEKMAPRSKLADSEKSALLDYLVTTREVR